MSEDRKVARRETLAAQGLGRVAEPYKEIVPPIHVATTYERGVDGGYPGGRVYSRADNPTYDQAEALIATGLLLFVVSFAVNFVARWIVARTSAGSRTRSRRRRTPIRTAA